MSTIERRLQAMEERFLPPPVIPAFFVRVVDQSIAEPGQPEPQFVTDADITGYSCGSVHVLRFAGESLDDLEARCKEAAPKGIFWLATYAERSK